MVWILCPLFSLRARPRGALAFHPPRACPPLHAWPAPSRLRSSSARGWSLPLRAQSGLRVHSAFGPAADFTTSEVSWMGGITAWTRTPLHSRAESEAARLQSCRSSTHFIRPRLAICFHHHPHHHHHYPYNRIPRHQQLACHRSLLTSGSKLRRRLLHHRPLHPVASRFMATLTPCSTTTEM